MGFSKSKRERIKKYILEKIENNDNQFVHKTADNFDISLTTVYSYIRGLCDDNIIEKCKTEGRKYNLKEQYNFFKFDTEHMNLEEDRIFDEEIDPMVEKLPSNIWKIWNYAFTEMMNNAIEHSEAKIITGYISQNYLNTTIVIIDNGIGIFEKIKAYYHYDSIEDAMSELFKGKLTTDSLNHSGEGIFFTSRILDNFAALSSGKIFTHNNHFDNMDNLEDIPCLKQWQNDKGTKIIMMMSNSTTKELKEVFDMYSNQEDGFIKTQIPIKNVFENGYPVSRSQARRLSYRFDDFKEVVLDFKDVEDIGQGFAHELFVVFHKKHPGVVLLPENCNENIQKMINHVTVNN